MPANRQTICSKEVTRVLRIARSVGGHGFMDAISKASSLADKYVMVKDGSV